MKLGFLVVAVVIFGMAAAVTPVESAADQDACTMVTPAQWSSALGVKMDEGKHTTETYVKTCTWSTAGTATGGVKCVTLHLQKSSEYDGGKNMATTMAQGKMSMESVSGVGDDAYFFNTPDGKIVGLLVKKGTGAFKVAIYGEMVTDKKKTAAKEIAGIVVGKM
jgi:hypothetical protein